jgi:hypothetical protein
MAGIRELFNYDPRSSTYQPPQECFPENGE